MFSHPPEPTLSVLDWAEERLANSQRIALGYSGAERESWLEDVVYWREIVARLREADAYRREANKQLQRNSELDNAHKKLKSRYKQALDLIGALRLAERSRASIPERRAFCPVCGPIVACSCGML